MGIALFCIMVERTKHIHAQRSFRFSGERHKTVAKRPITRGTFIYCYTVRLSKSPFFVRGWLHRLIEARFALFIELMRVRLVASLLHSMLKVTVCHSPKRVLACEYTVRNTAVYPQSSLTNSETSFPATSDKRRLYSQATRVPQEITGNECARIVYRISVSSDLATKG